MPLQELASGGRRANRTLHGWTAALNQFEIIFPGRLPSQI
jgi:hypothetical protein